MLFNYKDVNVLDRKHLIQMGEEFKIQNCNEIITKIIEAKHDFLLEFAIQYGVEKWASEVIELTSKVDRSLKE
jgi:hypothetical protein